MRSVLSYNEGQITGIDARSSGKKCLLNWRRQRRIFIVSTQIARRYLGPDSGNIGNGGNEYVYVLPANYHKLELVKLENRCGKTTIYRSVSYQAAIWSLSIGGVGAGSSGSKFMLSTPPPVMWVGVAVAVELASFRFRVFMASTGSPSCPKSTK